MKNTCLYSRVKSDGYETTWKTACREKVYCQVPEEVGFCSAPLPNENGKFCHFCGNMIELDVKK
jgi:hypothetical protein